MTAPDSGVVRDQCATPPIDRLLIGVDPRRAMRLLDGPNMATATAPATAPTNATPASHTSLVQRCHQAAPRR